MRKVPTAFGSACAAVVIAGMLALATGLAGHPIRAAGDDIGGVVTGPNGAEAGVWVIAETDDLETTFRKIVVTDDDGRFLVPDLPAGEYSSDYDSTLHAWDQRVQIGGSGGGMNGGMNRMGRERSLQMFAGWTDRIMAGEVPPVPPRPEGLERNVVLTQWAQPDSVRRHRGSG